MLKDRPYVRALLARFVRKIAIYYFNNHQFSQESFDQFMAKTRTLETMQALCDAVEELEFDWKNPRSSVLKNWNQLRPVVEQFDDVSLEHPTCYNYAPASRGRKVRRAMGPRYQDGTDFQKDKFQFEEEINGRNPS